MKPGALINLDSIKPHRDTRATAEEIQALANDIKKNGLRHPVLLTETDELVLDGLRRIAAFKLLNRSVLSAQYTDDAEEAIAALEEAREGAVLPIWRGADLIEDFKGIIDLRHSASRKRPRNARTPGLIPTMRSLYPRALGRSATSVDRLVRIRALAEKGSEAAKEMVTLVEAGKMTPATGYEMSLKGWKRDAPPEFLPSEHRTELVVGVVRTIKTSTSQLKRVGRIDSVQDGAVDGLISSLLASKREINAALSSLRKKVKE